MWVLWRRRISKAYDQLIESAFDGEEGVVLENHAFWMAAHMGDKRDTFLVHFLYFFLSFNNHVFWMEYVGDTRDRNYHKLELLVVSAASGNLNFHWNLWLKNIDYFSMVFWSFNFWFVFYHICFQSNIMTYVVFCCCCKIEISI